MAIPVEIPASVVTGIGSSFNKRRTIRADVNPLDKSTVVSIFPKHIHESKWTIQPGEFDIAPGSYERPAILIVHPSSYWRDVDPEQPLQEIPQSSIIVANAIVTDYCNGYLGADMSESMPGLFFVPGCKSDKNNEPNVEQTLQWIKTEHKALLDRAKVRQDNWYNFLVKIADTYWARTNGNPLSISDDSRMAARELGLEREWMKDAKVAEMIRCFACGSMRNKNYPVCAICKSVDQTHPLAKDLKFAV